MNLSPKRKLVVGGIAALAVAGAGAAIGATQFDSQSARSAAIVTDAANQLGVQPGALSNALKKAEENQVDAAVAAGRLTQAQADKIKAAIESGQAPLVGGGGFGRGLGRGGPGFGRGGGGFFGGGGQLAAAATYLGVTQAELQSDLQSGKTLASVATAQGKTAAGLVSAMVAAQKTKLDAAVTAGNLTQTQAQSIESSLQQRTTDLVNGTFPQRPDGEHGFRGGFGGGLGGPPQGGSSSGSSTFGGQTA
jgi:hypothetical protein